MEGEFPSVRKSEPNPSRHCPNHENCRQDNPHHAHDGLPCSNASLFVGTSEITQRNPITGASPLDVSPKRQLMFCLSDSIKVTSSTNEERVFEADMGLLRNPSVFLVGC